MFVYFKTILGTTDGFRERGALGHLNFSDPTQVRPILQFIWKSIKVSPLVGSAPKKISFVITTLVLRLRQIRVGNLRPPGRIRPAKLNQPARSLFTKL